MASARASLNIKSLLSVLAIVQVPYSDPLSVAAFARSNETSNLEHPPEAVPITSGKVSRSLGWKIEPFRDLLKRESVALAAQQSDLLLKRI